MSEKETFFKNLWNQKAENDDIFVQMGRSNSSFKEFFVTISEISNRLDLTKSDVVLDAGGGAGWYSIAISPFVKEIVLFDYSEKLIENAKVNIKGFSNINVYVDDLTKLENIPNKQFDKVISGSTLQYLENIENVEKCIQRMFEICKKGAKIYFTLNPDIRKKEAHIESYYRLSWTKERIEQSLKTEEMRLWTSPDELKIISKKIGFSDAIELSVNPDSWFSTHMYDILLIK